MQYVFLHEHHILPRSKFGKGKTVELCPNCHYHFHEYNKKQTTNLEDADEARRIWNIWFKTISVIVTMLIVAFFVVNML